MIIRNKHGVNSADRLKEIFNCVVSKICVSSSFFLNNKLYKFPIDFHGQHIFYNRLYVYSQLFDKLKAERGLDSLISKIKVISGDLSLLNLGISEQDRLEVTQNVDIIYSLAASVRFNDSLTKSVLTNTRGVRELLTLAKECKKLKVKFHVN